MSLGRNCWSFQQSIISYLSAVGRFICIQSYKKSRDIDMVVDYDQFKLLSVDFEMRKNPSLYKLETNKLSFKKFIGSL